MRHRVSQTAATMGPQDLERERMTETFTPGLAVIHANRLETLRDLIVSHLHEHPPAPLEQETVLVQSNGMAEWLRHALAAPAGPSGGGRGIAAAQRFVLPQSFLWQAYRIVLGTRAIPETSPFEKTRLKWRIYRLIPELLDQDASRFAPLNHYLDHDPDARKRHQLARRLADLYDQYQVYRPDWLSDWLDGQDVVRDARGQPSPLDESLLWQPALWRAIHHDVGPGARQLSRPGIQARFIEALEASAPGDFPALPRRLTVFGVTSMPRPALDALHALSRHCQILQLVHNPSGYFWADLIEDRELLKLDQRRHQRPFGTPGQPLLAAWGKQGRDFIALLNEMDEPERYRHWFQTIDAFEPPIDDPGRIADAPLLAQIQQDMFDLTPLPEAGAERRLHTDDSIRFHRAHSRQREVEILHDRLLDAFRRADERGHPLRPRDVIVMVPDVDAYAPVVEAVFGRLDPDDARYIPYTIGDRRSRSEAPVATAIERLSDLPNARLSLGDVLDLIEVAAFRRRFGLTGDDVALLREWARDAGVRWGLDRDQRGQRDAGTAFEQNSWRFGLRRLLLGYAVGTGEAWQGIEPYPEVGSVDARLLGPLRVLLDTLEAQVEALSQPGRPTEWAQRVEALLADCFALRDDDELAIEVRINKALSEWLNACEAAGFDEALPLSVAREAWLAALEDEGPSQRFLAGRVNICTMMPMRSIPFRQVCLLGMNDGDYPRTPPPVDFDLMARAGQYRPGDRSGREDDRYLFLEALLAARDHLHVSWIGRNPRDDSSQPPSVLVSQLRDHLDRGWALDDPAQPTGSVAERLTVDHPLQPFSPVYTGEGEYFTYATEWQHAASGAPTATPLAAPALETPQPLDLDDLHRFLRNTAQHFLGERLKLRFDEADDAPPETEPFALSGLAAHHVRETLLAPLRRGHSGDEASMAIQAAGARLERSGQLPVGGMGRLALAPFVAEAQRTRQRWQIWQAADPQPEPPQELRLARQIGGQHYLIEDWQVGVHRLGHGERLRLVLKTGDTRKGRVPHYTRLLTDWVAHLAINTAGLECRSVVIAHDATHQLPALPVDTAGSYLDAMLAGWRAGLQSPLPLPLRTVFALLCQNGGKPITAEAAAAEYEGTSHRPGEMTYAGNGALRRCFPSAASLFEAQLNGRPALIEWGERLYQPLIDHLTAETDA